MRIIDITRTVQEAPLQPGSSPVELSLIQDMKSGAPCNISMIKADSHAGTHADAFSQYMPRGGLSIDNMPLENYCGNCRVLSVPRSKIITVDDLRGRIGGVRRLCLHSGGGSFLSEETASYLAACRIRLLVTDAVSVAPVDNEMVIHRILFENGIAVIENAILDDVEDGDYLIFAFPIKYGGCDGAPVRAVLLAPS